MTFADSVVGFAERQSASGCPICFEQVCLEPSSCGHGACKDCLIQWMEQLEGNGQEATCFKCRQPMEIVDIRRVLRRDMVSISRVVATTVDVLTLDWIHERGIKHCPWCGVWVEKIGGCDYIQCRCGEAFCFCCGEKECPDAGEDPYGPDIVHELHVLCEALERESLEDRIIGYDAEFVWEGCKSKLTKRRRIMKAKRRLRSSQQERHTKTKSGYHSRMGERKSTCRLRKSSTRKESRWVVDRSER